MKTPNQSTSLADRAVVRALIDHPEELARGYHEARVGLMTALAAGELSGEDLALASQVRDTDAEARELYDLLVNLPAPDGCQDSIFEQFAAGLNRTLQMIYTKIAVFRSAKEMDEGEIIFAEGDEAVPEETILVQGRPCVLRRSRLPDGDYDVELVIPAGVEIAPEDLARLELRIVDRPQPLVFLRRPNGNLVANYVLPPSVDDPNKEIVVIARPPSSA